MGEEGQRQTAMGRNMFYHNDHLVMDNAEHHVGNNAAQVMSGLKAISGAYGLKAMSGAYFVFTSVYSLEFNAAELVFNQLC